MLELWDRADADLVVVLVEIVTTALAILLVASIAGGRRRGRRTSVRLANSSHEADRPLPLPALGAPPSGKTDGLESHRWVLAVREQALGPDHPDVASACHILGAMYAERGRFADAEPLLQRSLDIRKRALGPAHPEVALTIDDLADLYRAQGRDPEAQSLGGSLVGVEAAPELLARPTGSDALSDITRGRDGMSADADHVAFPTAPDGSTRAQREEREIATLSAGSVPSSTPDPAELSPMPRELAGPGGTDAPPVSAHELYRQTLAMMKATGATERPELWTTLRDLGRHYYGQHAYAEAEPLLERALALAQRALDADAPAVAEIREDLAWLRFSRRSLPGR